MCKEGGCHVRSGCFAKPGECPVETENFSIIVQTFFRRICVMRRSNVLTGRLLVVALLLLSGAAAHAGAQFATVAVDVDFSVEDL